MHHPYWGEEIGASMHWLHLDSVENGLFILGDRINRLVILGQR